MPSQAVLDKMAEQSLTGGWDIRRANVCADCWQAKSANGLCGC